MTRSLRAPRRAGLLVLGLSMTACAGPKAPLQVGVRELPSDVVLGDRSRHPADPVSVPVPPVALPLAPAQVPAVALVPAYEPPAEDVGPPPTPLPSPSCSIGSPEPAKNFPVPDTVTRPAGAARYAFETQGSYEVSGANAAKGTFPSVMVRSIRDVVQLPGAAARYRFTVDGELGRLLTSTTYTLVPESSSTTPLDAPGLYITKVVSRNVDGTTQEFTPTRAPGMLLLPFPATPGSTFRQSDADPNTGTVLSYTATIGEPQKMTVCGRAVGLLPVHLDGTTGGELSPDGGGGFVIDYAISPEYGGISLHDVVSVQRQSADSSFTQKFTTSVTTTPLPADRTPTRCGDPCPS